MADNTGPMTLSDIRLGPPDGFGGPKVIISNQNSPYELERNLPHELERDEECRRARRVASLVSLEAANNDELWLASKAPPDPSSTVPYIMLFGYSASDAKHWTKAGTAPLPQLQINVIEHAEVADHTWYTIDCALTKGGDENNGEAVRWQTARRLCHCRELWYTHVKCDLGPEYNECFSGAHFAHHGALAGTTSRLSAWCQALAACINSGFASPYIVGLTFRFLDAPHLLAIEQQLLSADVGIDTAMASALQAAPHVPEAEPPAKPAEKDIVPSPTRIGKVADASVLDTFDIDIDVGMKDGAAGQCAEGGMSLPTREAEASPAQARVVDIDGVVEEDGMPFPISEEGGMSQPSRSGGGYNDQPPPQPQPEYFVTDVVEFGLPTIEEEKTNLTSTTCQDGSLFEGASLPIMDGLPRPL